MLLNFFTIISQNWPIALLVTFCFWPGLMFVAGWIGESRIIPMGENQSKAFFPGDFAFGVMFVALAFFYAKANEIDPSVIKIIEEPSWIGFCIVLSIIFCIFRRRKERYHYPKRAFNSPTKICHDIVGYILIPFMLLWMEYPALSVFIRRAKLRGLHQEIGVVVLAWLLYIFCVWKDFTDAKMEEKALKYMHPADWQPLWKKTPPQ